MKETHYFGYKSEASMREDVQNFTFTCVMYEDGTGHGCGMRGLSIDDIPNAKVIMQVGNQIAVIDPRF